MGNSRECRGLDRQSQFHEWPIHRPKFRTASKKPVAFSRPAHNFATHRSSAYMNEQEALTGGQFRVVPRTGGYLLGRIRKSPLAFWTLVQPPKELLDPDFWLSRRWLTPRP